MAEMEQVSVELIRSSLQGLRAFTSDEVLSVFRDAAYDDELWGRAASDPHQFLSDKGIDIPRELTLSFTEALDPGDPPVPDWERLGVVGWRTFRYCTHERDSDGKPGPMTCEEITIPIFAGRLRRSC